MSCNVNNIMRTPYDQLMAKVYNPDSVVLYPAPWPMDKTDADMALQKKWCITDCGKYSAYPNRKMPMLNAENSNGMVSEGFAFPTVRENFRYIYY
jgi:hypothetical protein